MRHLVCAAVAACAASPALAQSQPTAAQLPSAADVAKRNTLTIGVGGAVLPDYEGSDDYRIVPAGAVRGRYDGISFATRGTYLYVDLIPPGTKFNFSAGPIVGARFNTRKHVSDPVVKLLPKLKATLEAGGFVGVSFHQLTNPYDTLAFRLDVLHGFGSGRTWTNFSPNIEFSTPVSRRTYVGLSAGLDFAADKFADYYFSVTPAGRLATGSQLPVFDPGGGMKDWKAGLLVNQSITGDLLGGLSVFGTGQYSRLVGDFKRSPIVAQRGSASQWLGAVGLAYTW